MIFCFKHKLVIDNTNREIGTCEYGTICVNDNKLYIPESSSIKLVYDIDTNQWYTLHYDCVIDRVTPKSLMVYYDTFVIYDLRFFDILCRPDSNYTDDEVLELKRNHIRERRRNECFTVINRGRLWYDSLPSKMYTKLNKWYQMWLDAPSTLIVPEYLYEIDNKLNQVEDIL